MFGINKRRMTIEFCKINKRQINFAHEMHLYFEQYYYWKRFIFPRLMAKGENYFTYFSKKIHSLTSPKKYILISW